MPSHHWGDESFDWDALYSAEKEIRSLLKWSRIGVHSKEKYGTLRWSLYFFDGTMYSLTHPGYVYSQYPKWLWQFDIHNKPLKLLRPVINFWQKLVVQYAFTIVCAKHPHIKDEIIMDAPRELLPPDLAIASAKLWSSWCRKCEKISTSDNYICPHCGEIK